MRQLRQLRQLQVKEELDLWPWDEFITTLHDKLFRLIPLRVCLKWIFTVERGDQSPWQDNHYLIAYLVRQSPIRDSEIT